GPPEARFRLASAWTGWDLTGSQAIHPAPLPCSKTPAESVVPHQSGPTDAAPAPNPAKASAVTCYASHATLPPPAQGSLPAGWLAFAGRGSNSPDRGERVQSVLTSSSFPGITLSQAGHTPAQEAGSDGATRPGPRALAPGRRACATGPWPS